MAESGKVSKEELIKGAAKASKKSASIKAISVDEDSAEVVATEDGVEYALFSVTVVTVIGSRQVSRSGKNLAIYEDGEWYIMSIEQPQSIKLVRQLYPGFQSIRFPMWKTAIAQ